MHSRIYSILFTDLNDETKINKVKLPSSNKLEEELEGYNFFDYIKDSDNLNSDIKWLEESYPSIFKISKVNSNVTKVVITKDLLESHYDEKNKRIKSYIEEKGIHSDDDSWVYHIQELIKASVGFFFYRLSESTDNWFYTCSSLDSFLLQVKGYFEYKKTDELIFYICGSYDYHM